MGLKNERGGGGVTLALLSGVVVLLGGVLVLSSGTVIYRKANTSLTHQTYAMHTI